MKRTPTTFPHFVNGNTGGALATITGGALGILLVGVVDYSTGHEIRVFPLYFLPIAFVAWRLTRSAAVLFAALSAATWVVANWSGGREYTSVVIWPINFASQFIAFGVVGYLVAELRRRLLAEQHLSRRDSLTGLPNGRAFHEQGELLLATARRAALPVTLAYIDLDNFKEVNDERGHHEGDRVLTETAEQLKQQLRSSDLAARLGGDEFVILLLDTGPDAARTALERLRTEVSAQMRQHAWPVTVSVGAVSYARPPSSLQDAIRHADSLMYAGKRSGKDRVHIEVVQPRADLRPPRRASSP